MHFTEVSRKKHHLKSEKGNHIPPVPPLCFSGILVLPLQLFFFFFFLTHFADKKSEPGQCHGANKGWRDLNTVHLILSAFTTCFYLLYMTWAFFSSLCCLHFCLILKNNFRNRMSKNNLLIFLWPPAVIMRLGVSCKGLLQVLSLPLAHLAFFF